VTVTPCHAARDSSGTRATPLEEAKSQLGVVAIKPASFLGRCAVVSSDFSLDIAGGKSCNLNRLRGKLPDWVKLPASVALPYGTFDAVVGAQENAGVAQRLRELSADLGACASDPSTLLAQVRQVVSRLVPTSDAVSALREAFCHEGLAWPGDPGVSEGGSDAWAAITGVWASKWNDRAYLSCRKAALDHSAISMAVLCQQVVQARYAFVLHTTNPSTGNDQELYAEVVCGLGETLVGNYAGRALSCSAPKADVSQLAVRSFPSKSVGLFVDCPTFIFRSDSNAEDLEGFAGAGLYDSIVMGKGMVPRAVDYSSEPLVCDIVARTELLTKIARVGLCIEEIMGSAQDIEGVVDFEGNLFVVQTRPQV